METWCSKVAVYSAHATALAPAMARTLLDTLSDNDIQGKNIAPPNRQEVEDAILSIASELKTILGEAMSITITIFQ